MMVDLGYVELVVVEAALRQHFAPGPSDLDRPVYDRLMAKLQHAQDIESAVYQMKREQEELKRSEAKDSGGG